MKTASFFSLLLLALVCSLGVTGCKKNPKSPTPIFSGNKGMALNAKDPNAMENPGPTLPQSADPRSTQLPMNQDGTTPLGERPLGDLSNYLQDRDIFKQDTVYFEFDKSAVKPGELPKIQSVAEYLKGQSNSAVLIEGHCDERGTPEYNRSLGERRALSVRESLISLGVGANRIHTVSFGEDKPAENGHNEAAWGKNRRAEFVLLKLKPGLGGDSR